MGLGCCLKQERRTIKVARPNAIVAVKYLSSQIISNLPLARPYNQNTTNIL